MSKISYQDVPSRVVDEATTIRPIFDGSDFNFDIAIGELSGGHGNRINRRSDRIYHVVSGELEIVVGTERYTGRERDTFVIPAGTRHGVAGTGEVMIITSPSFDPTDEVDVD